MIQSDLRDLWIAAIALGVVFLAMVGLFVMSGVDVRPEGEMTFSNQDAVPEPMVPLGQDTTADQGTASLGDSAQNFVTSDEDLSLRDWDARDLTVYLPDISDLEALGELVFRSEEQRLVARFEGRDQVILQYDQETGWSVVDEHYTAGADPGLVFSSDVDTGIVSQESVVVWSFVENGEEIIGVLDTDGDGLPDEVCLSDLNGFRRVYARQSGRWSVVE